LLRSLIDWNIVQRTLDRGGAVETVTISPKFQVVIPRSVRERLNLKPGQQVQVIPYENRIEFIPLRPARELRGALHGMPTDLVRDEDRL
jgi:AbrB family looped-hinge helix DNA binding protein